MKVDKSNFKEFQDWLKSDSKKSEGYFDRLYPLIGQIASAFALLEYELNNSFALAVNDSNIEIGLSISDQLTFSEVVQLFEIVAQNSTIENSKRFRERLQLLIKDLKESARLRNDIIHCSFGYIMGSDGLFIKTPSRIRGKSKNRGSPIVNPLPDLAGAYEHISQNIDSLTSFTTDYL